MKLSRGLVAGLLLVSLTSMAWAEESGAGGGEHVGTWLGFLTLHGKHLTPPQQAFAFSLLLILILCVAAVIGGRRFQVHPGRFQSLLETALGALRNIAESVMGPTGVGFLPFLGTIFLYVFLMNVLGMLPGFLSPTSSLSITCALALIVFVTVQFYGLWRHKLGYLKHFLEGLPLQGAFLLLAPLIFVIHLVGEMFRPVSLALRLFGNVTGEETTVLTLIGLITASSYAFWVPIQLPNLVLGLITSFVQALIFSLLTAVYLAGVLAHES